MVNDGLHDLENLKADIASRLRSVCAHFPEEVFADLVNQIAHVELKYAQRITATPVDVE